MRSELDSGIPRRLALKRAALAGGALVSSCFLKLTTPVGASGAQDVTILHAALYLEHEAIAAYEAGAGSGLLSADVLKVAAAFMDDHKYHRDGIVSTLTSLGETPDVARARYAFGRLQSANDVLNLALRLEQGAATAYRTLASSVENRAVLGFAAHVLADEVRHATVLRAALELRNY